MKVEKPIFVLGAPRSGTTWLGKVLAQHPDIAHWGEINNVWIWGNTNRPDDVLTENELNPRIQKYIIKKFANYLKKYGKSRICDKTPRNSLRISFIHAVFPDAKIIMMLRDGRSVISSTKKKLKYSEGLKWKEVYYRLKEVPLWEWYIFLPRLRSRLRRMLGRPLDYWGARPPGWQEWSGKYPSHIMLAKQWAETMKIATSEGGKLPMENYFEISYEELVNFPQEGFQKLINFVDLNCSDSVIEFAMATADPSRVDKWQDILDQTVLNEIKGIMEPVMTQLGYCWETQLPFEEAEAA